MTSGQFMDTIAKKRLRAIDDVEKSARRESIIDAAARLFERAQQLPSVAEVAQELGYLGELNGSTEMNLWLHKQVMTELAQP